MKAFHPLARRLRWAVLGLAVLSGGAACAEDFKTAFPTVFRQIDPSIQAGTGALELRHGKVALPGGVASLDLPDGFYFLDGKDARYVLETLWENPPDDTVLGMVLPKGVTPFEGDSFAAVVTYEPIGYVKDTDAATIDYDALLDDMKRDALSANDERVKAGFSRIELLGWAAPPRYDAEGRKLYWAKRLQFSDADGETLNYNIRALGREGVLVVNFIAGMAALPAVETALPDVLKMIEFNQGHRYSDYLPGTDTVAAVGIGGLIAGKLAAKAGLLAVALVFIKKLGVLVLLPLAWVWRKISGRREVS